MADGSESTSLDEANLSVEDGARLLALADGLCRIGQARDGANAGQFSVFNFLIRAAYEDAAAGTGPAPLVVLMRAGVFRRHTWFTRMYWGTGGQPAQMEVPSALDKDWTWQADIDEIRKRLVEQGVWQESVGESFEQRVAAVAAELAEASVVRIDARDERRRWSGQR